MAALLWGVGYIEVPPVLGTGLLVLAGLIVALFCLWTRRWVAIAVGAACVAAIGVFVVDVLVLERNVLLVGSRAEWGQPRPAALRLLDFNVLHGYPHFPDQEARAQRTIARLATLDLDVIILQEAWRTRQHGDFVAQLGDALGMDSAFARANGNLERIGFEEGEAILSRFPILQAIRIQLEPRKPFFERRVALIGVLDLGEGETLAVLGTHLDHRDLDTANAQAAHLAGRIASLPVGLVAGDLNAPSGSRATDVFERLGFADIVPGGIDHVLVSKASPWKVETARWVLQPSGAALGQALSDHPGILVNLARSEPLSLDELANSAASNASYAAAQR